MLNRTAQIGSKVESAEGTEEALTAAEFQGKIKETNHKYATGEYDREIEQGSLSKSPNLKGSNSLMISITEELVGGAASTVAPWHTRMRALGFEQLGVLLFDTTSPSGSIVTGEIVTDTADPASATKRGRVLATDTNKLYIVSLEGAAFADTETIYGQGAGGGNVDISGAGAAAGYAFLPVSENSAQISDSITHERRLGGQKHTLVGGRGTGGLSFRWDEPALLSSEITGVPLFDVTGGARTPKAGSELAVTPLTDPPAVCKGIGLGFREAGGSVFTPIATELVLTFGNTVEQRQTIGAGLGSNYESGYLASRITDREITATVDPEHILPAGGFDFIDAMQRGETFELSAMLGLPSDANGAISVFAPAAQLTGEYEPGDRNGITTSPLNVRLTGNDDDELVIGHLFG